jgi:hypothetical protein
VRKTKPKTTLGWVEHIDLPEWGIAALPAKLDTGARTSALHVRNVREVGQGNVRFEFVPEKHGTYLHQSVVAPIHRTTYVRSSTGAREPRYIVRTQLVLGTVKKTIEVSLASRDSMRFRMLLGRQALRRDFLVNVSRKHLITREDTDL